MITARDRDLRVPCLEKRVRSDDALEFCDQAFLALKFPGPDREVQSHDRSRRALGFLDRKLGDFAERGVNVVVVSSDEEARARKAKEDWKMENLTVGYGLDLDTARAWGLYVSAGIGKTSIGIEEPALFSEPGLFLIRPDGTLYFGSVQTMPFARPAFGDILKAVDFAIARNYPARGEVVDESTGD